MKHILVPIGSSENAANTLQYAIDFAETINANIFVFRAYNIFSKAGTMINLDDLIIRETNLYMRSVVNTVDTKNTDVKIIAGKGKVSDSISSIHSQLGIELIIMGPKSNSIKEELFLGKTSGSIIKHTEIPTLIIPESYSFKAISNVLLAFKSGVLNKVGVLNPLKVFTKIYNPIVNLLLVKTPGYSDTDLELDSAFDELNASLKVTESATTFQGVLANLSEFNPDMLCVFRRKRGFFKKLLEKNEILKEEFNCTVPLLILSGKQ